jgi:hypothetical protein
MDLGFSLITFFDRLTVNGAAKTVDVYVKGEEALNRKSLKKAFLVLLMPGFSFYWRIGFGVNSLLSYIFHTDWDYLGSGAFSVVD